MSAQSTVSEIKDEMISRFGFVPPFFEPASASPAVMENLWRQTLSCYIDNPIPALFKERLAAYLARECTIPYFLIVHSCSLRPLGMAAPAVLELLTRSDLRASDVTDCVSGLQSNSPCLDWPESGSELEELLFNAATIVFTRFNAASLQKELRRVLGEEFFSHLTLFLSYNSMCHKWAESHPELGFEADERAAQHLKPLLDEVPELDDFFKTYQVRLRQKVIDREAELLSKEFRMLFEKSPMPILITDLDLKIVRVNDSFAELTGYSSQDLLGSKADNLDAPQFNSNSNDRLQPLRDGTSSAVMDEKIILHKSGRHVSISSTVSIIRAGNFPVYLISLIKDNTLERSELEREKMRSAQLEQSVLERTAALQVARDEAIQANSLKTQFVSSISHEIRTPMTGILGLSELLVLETSGETRESAEHIFKAANDLMVLVDDLLDMSKLESGKFSIFRNKFNISEEVNGVVNTFQMLANKKNLAIKTDFDQNIPEAVIGDQFRIGQILKNLVLNAVKFSDRGVIRVRTELVSKDCVSTRVVFSVTDEGIGISQEDQKKLFQLFVQLDGSNTRKYGGTGLGLTISKRLVEMMHGTISVTSEKNVGSTFAFELPFELPI